MIWIGLLVVIVVTIITAFCDMRDYIKGRWAYYIIGYFLGMLSMSIAQKGG